MSRQNIFTGTAANDVTLSAGSASDITVNGFELSHTSAATITVEVDAGL